MTNRCGIALGALCAGIAVSGLALASDPPDSAVNPQSGNIEIVDPVWAATNQDINYVINGGPIRNIETAADDPLDDRNPRMVIASNGDAWITWWRDDDTDAVLVRRRHYSDGTWDNERVLSSGTESSRNPAIADDGTDRWVAYEFDDGNETTIAVSLIIDEPDPISVRTALANTSYTESRDVLIHVESGNLWVTWIHSSTDVGWVEYDDGSESWSTAGYESYAQDSVVDARDRVRNAVVAN